MPATNNMRFRIIAQDKQPNHYVEALFDEFQAGDYKTVRRVTHPHPEVTEMSVFPNPNKGSFKIKYEIPKSLNQYPRRLVFYTMTGEIIRTEYLASSKNTIEIKLDIPPQLVFVMLYAGDNRASVQKILIQE